MTTTASSPVDQSNNCFSLDGGDEEIEICDSLEEKVASNLLKTAAIAMDFAADGAGLEKKQQHPASSNAISSSSSTTASTSSDEKDENRLSTNNGLNSTKDCRSSTRSAHGGENGKIIIVKKKKAIRPSLNEFFKKAAAAAAALQEQRPKTRHGGKRDGTNQFESNGALKKPSAEPSSTKTNNSSSGRSNSQKGVEKSSGKRSSKPAKGENAPPPSKKQRKTSLPPQQAAPKPPTSSYQQAQVEQRPVIEKIVEPKPDDVLMGRGSVIANWHGNIRFRKAVWAQRPAYCALCDKGEKTTFIENLVMQIQNQGCRFLEMAGKSGTTTSPVLPHGIVWVEASFERALEKTSKALRDPKWTTRADDGSLSPQPSNSDSSSARPEVPETRLSNSPERHATALTTNTQQSTPLTDVPYRLDYAVEDYPLISLPRANDVIFGRGGSFARHHGNIQFRLFVRSNRQRYLDNKKKDKINVTRDVVDMVVQTGGRFLELVGNDFMTGPFKHASYTKCLDKTSQALREMKWGSSPSSTTSCMPERLIPVENPEADTTNWNPSPSPANAKEGSDNSSTESSPSQQEEEDSPSAASTQEQMASKSKEVAIEEIVLDSKTAEEQMCTLGDGSRVAVYWPLDRAYYEGTVEDRLQDNFFYVRYDDGESEWLDLSKHAFKVIKAAPEAPAPVEQVASKRKESTGKKKIAVKKKSCGGSKKKSTGNERKTSTKKAPVIRSSFQRSKQILDAIEKHGMEDWELVASEVPDWSAEDCRRRWALYLDPTLSRKPFTKKEIRQILLFQSKHGNDWMVLAPKLERRSCSYISDRWNRKFRKLAVGHLLKLGLTEDQIEGDEKKRINYHGHFEAVLKVVVAAKP